MVFALSNGLQGAIDTAEFEVEGRGKGMMFIGGARPFTSCYPLQKKLRMNQTNVDEVVVAREGGREGAGRVLDEGTR